MPAKTAAKISQVCLVIAKASGSACKKVVDNMKPTDRLTISSTILDKAEKDKTAAMVKLTAPEIRTASKIQISVLMLISSNRSCIAA